MSAGRDLIKIYSPDPDPPTSHLALISGSLDPMESSKGALERRRGFDKVI